MSGIITELKRRNVFKVGTAYVVAAWLIIQFSDILLDNMEAPSWVLNAIMLLLVIGFIVTLFVAWAFEVTPEGIKRESEVDRSQSITPQTGKKLNGVLTVLLALAIGYIVFDKFWAPENMGSESNSQVASIPPQQASGENLTLTPSVSRQSIAVLPFDNRSPDPADAYFTDGIHDDLLTNLSRVSALKVISRTSVTQYKGTEKTIPQIAKELGVAHVMEGAVQRAGNQVRINVQLIDAVTDEHLWAEIFDRELTAENLFAIQSEISEAIAGQLEAALSPQEEQRINQMPTHNLAAYESFLKGRQLMATRDSEQLGKATAAFQRAVDLDPEFALAWVNLGDAHWLWSVYGTVPQEEARSIRKHAIDRALAIDPELGEAHTSRASHLHTLNRHEEAEEAFKLALELNPNYATAHHWYGIFLENFPLRVDEAIAALAKALELDPNSLILNSTLASVYGSKGLLSLAERQYRKTMALDPEFSQAYVNLADLYNFTMDRYADAQQLYMKALELDPGNIANYSNLVELYLAVDDTNAAKAIHERMLDIDPNHRVTLLTAASISAWSGNRAAFNEALPSLLPRYSDSPVTKLYIGFLQAGLGDLRRARDLYVSVNPGWLVSDQWQRLIHDYPVDACIFSWLLLETGEAELGRGLLAEARQYLDVQLPAVNEHADDFWPVICHLADGDLETALDNLEMLVAHGHLHFWRTGTRLGLFDIIRDHPRFLAANQRVEARMTELREAMDAARTGVVL